ncbi:unnamed protein product [Arctogadus glacialis]
MKDCSVIITLERLHRRRSWPQNGSGEPRRLEDQSHWGVAVESALAEVPAEVPGIMSTGPGPSTQAT